MMARMVGPSVRAYWLDGHATAENSMYTTLATIVALFGLLVMGCADNGDDSGASEDLVAWSIYPYQTVCNGEGQWLCPIGQRSTASSWEPIPCGIAGLDYVWGVSLELQAEITDFSDPAVDGCGDIWTLRSIESSVFDSAGVAFELPGVWGSFIEVGTGGGTVLGEAFVCGSTEVCDELALLVSDGSLNYRLSMQVGAAEGDPLVLVGLTAE
jgi:hypothetical protein